MWIRLMHFYASLETCIEIAENFATRHSSLLPMLVGIFVNAANGGSRGKGNSLSKVQKRHFTIRDLMQWNYQSR